MKDTRKLEENAQIKKVSAMADRDKILDESMSSLIAWLVAAKGSGFLSKEKAQEIFNEELKERFGYTS